VPKRLKPPEIIGGAGTGEIKIEVAFTLETGIGPEVGRWSKTRNG